jgi:2-succinyl-6-hydroxy-2,4-cyclohexadiene-1-carboxylate synthase
MTRFAVPGGELRVRRMGAGPRLVALHGFTHHGGSFAELAGFLDHEILAPDLPGHGGTTVSPTYDAAVAALAFWLEAFGAPVPLLGYSQGGRIALHLALAEPGLVSRLVLVSTSPGIADAGERGERRERDDALAARIESGGIAAFLDAWLAGPIAGTTELRDAEWRKHDRARRKENDPARLAAALRGLTQGRQEYLGDRLQELPMPVLVIAGEYDPAYVERSETMVRSLPDGRLLVIPEAPHNVVGANPAALAAAVQDFLTASV